MVFEESIYRRLHQAPWTSSLELNLNTVYQCIGSKVSLQTLCKAAATAQPPLCDTASVTKRPSTNRERYCSGSACSMGSWSSERKILTFISEDLAVRISTAKDASDKKICKQSISIMVHHKCSFLQASKCRDVQVCCDLINWIVMFSEKFDAADIQRGAVCVALSGPGCISAHGKKEWDLAKN